jgi:Zn-dependent M32 family carboxypeptidase
MGALSEIHDRMSELADLAGLDMLAQWDQRVMMPHDDAAVRASSWAR